MNKEKPCQGKNSDSAKKFVRTSLIAIRGGSVLYTPKNALPRRPGDGSVALRAPGTGSAASEGGLRSWLGDSLHRTFLRLRR